jgi:hypothetical protein
LLYASPTYKNYPWFIAGGLKIVYDLLLLWSFHGVKPDSERAPVNVTGANGGNGTTGNAHQATALLSNFKKTGDVEMNRK